MNTEQTATLPASILVDRQRLKFGPKVFTEDGETYRIIAEVRHDDSCKNGHNSFSITGTIDRKSANGVWRNDRGGCIHDEVAKHFPELAPLIKWHLTSTDGPLHYLANTIYHAGDKDHYGRAAGEASHFDHFIQFGNSPVLHKTGTKFFNWLKQEYEAGHYFCEVAKVEYPPQSGDSYKFKPKYTFTGFLDNPKWHECPFDSLREATEWRTAFIDPEMVVRFKTIATDWSEGKPRELDSARSSAVWPDATDEELTAPGLKQRLIDRLPALMLEFKAAVESLGLVY